MPPLSKAPAKPSLRPKKFKPIRVARLRLKPGDRLAVFSAAALSNEAASRIRELVREWVSYPYGPAAQIPIIIFERGMAIGIVNEKDLQAGFHAKD